MISNALVSAAVAGSLILPQPQTVVSPPKPAIVKPENLEFSKNLLAMPITLGMLSKAQPPTLTYIGTASTVTSNTSITASFNVGASVDPNREAFLVAQPVIGVTGTLSATTFAGTTATTATSNIYDVATTSYGAVCFFASLPTQSGSQTFTLTFSSAGNLAACNIYLYIASNRPGKGTNQSSGTAVKGGSSVLTYSNSSVTIPAKGFMLVAFAKGGTGAFTATPTTPFTQQAVASTRWIGNTGIQASGSTPTVSFTWSTASGVPLYSAWAFG